MVKIYKSRFRRDGKDISNFIISHGCWAYGLALILQIMNFNGVCVPLSGHSDVASGLSDGNDGGRQEGRSIKRHQRRSIRSRSRTDKIGKAKLNVLNVRVSPGEMTDIYYMKHYFSFVCLAPVISLLFCLYIIGLPIINFDLHNLLIAQAVALCSVLLSPTS